jgi:hypothetical protein
MNSMIPMSLKPKKARVSFKRQRWSSRKEKEGERRSVSSRWRGDGLGDVLATMGWLLAAVVFWPRSGMESARVWSVLRV